MLARHCRWMSFAIAAFFALAIHAAEDIVRLPLGKVGTLMVPVPAGSKRTEPSSGSAAMLSFESVQRNRMQLLLTPIPLATSFMADEEVREVVERGSASVRAQSVERTFPLLRLQGEQARGYYFRATDRAPRADEYKYLYQGAVLVGATIVTFTVLYNDDAKHEADAALEVVRKMQLQTVGGI